MRMLSKILAGATAATFAVALAAGPAMADPTGTPASKDAVGVGSDTTQFLLDQLASTYNSQAGHTAHPLASWDAVPQGQNITVKADGTLVGGTSDCSIVRPTGSGAGITALEQNATTTDGTGFCIDFARSSRARGTSDPLCSAAGGICFVALAGDAVTWAARSSASGGTNAPATLTLAQLKKIYTCKTNGQPWPWNQVGGTSTALTKPFLPQTSSGTRSFFLTALGGGTAITPGACVSDTNNTLIENEGDAPELNDINAIFPYSIADYIAQSLHSATCTNGATCGYPAAPACTPGAGQNTFGCNLTGVLSLGEIAGKAPITSGKITATFPIQFQRTVFDVVRSTNGGTPDNIPAYLEPIFASATAATKGWACTNAKAKTAITNYGFLTTPKTSLGGPCGHSS